jgi:dihydrofolate reductase
MAPIVSIEAIVAVDQAFGLAKNGQIPWKSKTDMNFFKKTTTNNIIVMGINTLMSLKNATPLPNRLNIVLTRNPDKYNTIANSSKETNKYKEMDNILFMDESMFLQFLKDPNVQITETHNKYLKKDYTIFIIGGEQIYRQFCDKCDTIWLTKIKANYECDLIFSFNSRLFDTDHYQCEVYYEDEELQIMRLQLYSGSDSLPK